MEAVIKEDGACFIQCFCARIEILYISELLFYIYKKHMRLTKCGIHRPASGLSESHRPASKNLTSRS